MDNIISLAYEILRVIREGVAPLTKQERMGMQLAVAVLTDRGLEPAPGPWTFGWEKTPRPRRSVLDESPVLDDIARKLLNEKIVEQPASGTLGARRVIYRQSGSGLYRIEQRREVVWQTQSVKRVVAMDVDTQEAPKEVQTELDRLAPLDPRD